MNYTTDLPIGGGGPNWDSRYISIFCEGTYWLQLVPGVDEFFNGLSGLGMTIISIFGFYQSFLDIPAKLLYASIFVTGIGTLLNHFWLVEVTRLLDVFPMLVTVTFGMVAFVDFYVEEFSFHWRQHFHLVTYSFIQTYLIVGLLIGVYGPAGSFSYYFGVGCGLCIPAILVICYGQHRKNKIIRTIKEFERRRFSGMSGLSALATPANKLQEEERNPEWRTGLLAIGSMLFALLFRVLDVSQCNNVFVYFLPHVIWHVFVGFGGHCIVVFITYHRAHLSEIDCMVEYKFGFFPMLYIRNPSRFLLALAQPLIMMSTPIFLAITQTTLSDLPTIASSGERRASLFDPSSSGGVGMGRRQSIFPRMDDHVGGAHSNMGRRRSIHRQPSMFQRATTNFFNLPSFSDSNGNDNNDNAASDADSIADTESQRKTSRPTPMFKRMVTFVGMGDANKDLSHNLQKKASSLNLQIPEHLGRGSMDKKEVDEEGVAAGSSSISGSGGGGDGSESSTSSTTAPPKPTLLIGKSQSNLVRKPTYPPPRLTPYQRQASVILGKSASDNVTISTGNYTPSALSKVTSIEEVSEPNTPTSPITPMEPSSAGTSETASPLNTIPTLQELTTTSPLDPNTLSATPAKSPQKETAKKALKKPPRSVKHREGPTTNLNLTSDEDDLSTPTSPKVRSRYPSRRHRRSKEGDADSGAEMGDSPGSMELTVLAEDSSSSMSLNSPEKRRRRKKKSSKDATISEESGNDLETLPTSAAESS